MFDQNYSDIPYDERNSPQAGYNHGVGQRGKTGTKSEAYSDNAKDKKGSGTPPLKMA